MNAALLSGAIIPGLAWLALLLAYRRKAGRAYPARRMAFGAAGVAALALALCDPLDRLADASFAWHMVQHLLLLLVAPPLVLLGRPLELALAVASRGSARRIVAALRSPALVWLQHPATGFLSFAAVAWIAHFSGLYEAAAENEGVHALEHAAFLITAFAFWSPVIGATPFPVPLPFPVRIFYLFVAMPPMAFLGFALYELRRSPYPHYPSLADVTLGGEIMWIGGAAVAFLALMIVGVAWAAREERFAERDRAETLV